MRDILFTQVHTAFVRMSTNLQKKFILMLKKHCANKVCNVSFKNLMFLLKLVLIFFVSIFILLVCVQVRHPPLGATTYNYPYTWQCVSGQCVKQSATANVTQQSLGVCMLRCCSYAGVWPRPASIKVSQSLTPISSNSISITSGIIGAKIINEDISRMVKEISTRFTDLVAEMDKAPVDSRAARSTLEVSLLMEYPEVLYVTENVEESYKLSLKQSHSGRVQVRITAPTYFGTRHGLETLGQLIVYDHVSNGLMMPSEIEIEDRPAYPYRGVLLDTARSYVSVPVLRRLIDTMAANKLNTFHWHITDSHSFPFQSRSFPQMSQYGAYAPEKVYTETDIVNLVEFARVRGVRVVPELDAPAHVGEGWQWTEAQQAVVCFKQNPWKLYCVEPPCGQINPTSNYAYTVLQGIYKDMERLFHSDLFHMGGDEVNVNCWNSSASITNWMKANNFSTDDDGFHKLWDVFQTRALDQLDSVSRNPHQIVMWTSSLTEKGRVEKYLNSSRYIIQIWTLGNDPLIAELVTKGFRVIFSNYDALYFDCGFGAWVGEGNNWCSPYIGWQKVYENKPLQMLEQLGVNISTELTRRLVLGQEATLWTEQADDQVIDQRIWPRAAAMAERLWSDPAENWRAAEHRFLFHRERLVDRGTPADTIEPLWCLQNQGYCYA